jgi:hypothetical protein
MKKKLILKADFVNGEGSVGNIDEWREHDALLRADILKDWIYDLQQEYDLAVKELWGDEEYVDETPPQLNGIAGEILKHSELIGVKTVFAMFMPSPHEHLLMPSAIEKVEKFLTDNSNGCVEVVFQTESNYGSLQ